MKGKTKPQCSPGLGFSFATEISIINKIARTGAYLKLIHVRVIICALILHPVFLNGIITQLKAQSPTIYSTTNINLISQGVYETWNCAYSIDPVMLSTDTIYSSYLWSNGDTTHYTFLPVIGDTATLTLTVSHIGGIDSSIIHARPDKYRSMGNHRVFHPYETESCPGPNKLITSHAPNSDSIVWSTGDIGCPTTFYDGNDFLCAVNVNLPNATTNASFFFTRYTDEGCIYRSVTQLISTFDTTAPTILQLADTLIASQTRPFLIYGASYQWYDGNLNPIPGATQRTFVTPSPGTYSVRVEQTSMAGNVCNTPFATTTLVNSQLALDHSNISIYPNPAKDQFYLKNAAFGDQKLKVVDLRGRTMMEVRLNDGPYSTADLSNGIYLIKVTPELPPLKLVVRHW